jgi:hypothetical protein
MMRAVNRWTSLLALVLCACGSSELPLPSIASVTPTSMAANERILLTVELQGTFPFKVDYDEDSARLVTSARVSIADQPFEILRREEKGKRLLVEISPGLPVGQQELRVELADGQQVVSAEGFQVTPPLDITGLSIDPIPSPQIRLRPFNLRVRVAGPDAELFKGRVNLRVSRGSIMPAVCGPFSNGTCLVEIVLDDTGGANLTITAEDAAGHVVTSNDFRLNPN